MLRWATADVLVPLSRYAVPRRVQTIRAAEGSETARYAALLNNGLYAAAYLGVGLRDDRAGDVR